MVDLDLFYGKVKFVFIYSYKDEKRLQANVMNSEDWTELWDMLYNNKKCKHMRIRKERSAEPYTMRSGQELIEIEQVKSEKDLGVIFDDKLLFREHISKNSALANRNLGLIFKSFNYLDKEVFLALYKSLVRPHLEYLTTVWSLMYKKDTMILENTQRRATKMVNSLSNVTYEERLKKLGLPTLEYRRMRADVIEVYKSI